MNRPVLAVTAAVCLLAVAGCRSEVSSARQPELPATASPCASPSAGAPSSTGQPFETKIAWRAEELTDRSLRMTIGDVDTAPKSPDAVRSTDYRAPGSQTECDDVRIIKVHGWWCATTVAPIAQDGEIVLGGATPRARIHSTGFLTHCSGRAPRIRQHYLIQRDSWSGWRSYSEPGYTAWTREQDQAHAAVSVPCPAGRVGTYNYRLAVAVDVDGIQADDSTAASAAIRADCGTGIS